MQILHELRICTCVLIFSGKMCDIYKWRKFWVYTNLMLIIQNGSRFVLIKIRAECPCVRLFVMHLVAKGTRDETSELVRTCQIQENEEISSRMGDYYWRICFMNTLLSNVLTDLSWTAVVHVLFKILNSLRELYRLNLFVGWSINKIAFKVIRYSYWSVVQNVLQY